MVVVLVLVLVAAGTDLARRKIYNWNTYSGIIAGLALNSIGSGLERFAQLDGKIKQAVGWIGLEQSLLGFLACGLIMLACFVLFGVAGGDVKLVAMLGAWLGLEQGIAAMLWSFVLGGCMGLIVLIWQVGALRLLGLAARQLFYTLRLGRQVPLPDDQRRLLKQKIYLAPAAALAVLIVRLDLIGWW